MILTKWESAWDCSCRHQPEKDQGSCLVHQARNARGVDNHPVDSQNPSVTLDSLSLSLNSLPQEKHARTMSLQGPSRSCSMRVSGDDQTRALQRGLLRGRERWTCGVHAHCCAVREGNLRGHGLSGVAWCGEIVGGLRACILCMDMVTAALVVELHFLEA